MAAVPPSGDHRDTLRERPLLGAIETLTQRLLVGAIGTH